MCKEHSEQKLIQFNRDRLKKLVLMSLQRRIERFMRTKITQLNQEKVKLVGNPGS